jgi:hypothetical protein
VQDLQNSDVAIIGAPFDTGASFRAGARFGPEGIRSASHLLRPYNPSLDISIFEHLSVVDIGTISITVEPWMPVDAVARLYQEARRRMLGKKPRGMGSKSLALVEFVEILAQGLSWRERMNLWNGLYTGDDEYQYMERSNFRRACEKARRLLRTPGYAQAPHGEQVSDEVRRRHIEDHVTNAERAAQRFLS